MKNGFCVWLGKTVLHIYGMSNKTFRNKARHEVAVYKCWHIQKSLEDVSQQSRKQVTHNQEIISSVVVLEAYFSTSENGLPHVATRAKYLNICLLWESNTTAILSIITGLICNKAEMCLVKSKHITLIPSVFLFCVL